MSEQIIVFTIIGLVTVVVSVWLILRMPRGRVGEVSVQPSVPFELRCAPANAKSYRIGLDYVLRVTGRDDRRFGLACQLTAAVHGQQVLEEVVGVGYRARAVMPITKERDLILSGSTTRSSGYVDISRTAMLVGLGPRAHGSEIVIRGVISTTDNVQVGSLHLFLAR